MVLSYLYVYKYVKILLKTSQEKSSNTLSYFILLVKRLTNEKASST